MVNRVLFVCHANLCRSPMAEFTARRLLAGRPVTVASAGTDAMAGLAMHPYAAKITVETGEDPTGFRSRRLAPEHLTDAVLVLTATRRQRSFCTALAPAALHRTFTLRQFGRLAATVEAPLDGHDEPLRAAVAAAALARGRLQPALADADDLVDPVAGTLEDFRRCAQEIERALRPLATLIGTAG
ncbi:low molecular weight phosphatase family protein [Micromonospora endophytica]|uniref:Low molecular weight phosphatase family protein n=1 Tax=Micromonospora endophytica TaxID=515350 RepID=A0A2W2CQT2_9ACTN|nr:low molecular weight phosphatase family protein [Micromonospora endophytica]PZF90467.1 low molecular weight phosphatase family protein [Micromonospora endophytica]RIW48273.1 low molecular weight phosphatase family protein [Micromonospora endophytica]BCJ56663.1 protein-tyrosine-phosphatase [Micromonospora endophytica]